MGGYEPLTGPPLSREDSTYRRLWFTFATAEEAGHVSLATEGDTILHTDGHIVFPTGSPRPALRVVDVDIDVEYRAVSPTAIAMTTNTPLFDEVTLRVTTDDGHTWTIESAVVVPQIVMRGAGYDDGFDDGQGLGLYRGEYVEETDVYDVSERGGDVYLLPERTIFPQWHREHLMNATVDGRTGQSQLTIWALRVE
jgi:hypothetical protein